MKNTATAVIMAAIISLLLCSCSQPGDPATTPTEPTNGAPRLGRWTLGQLDLITKPALRQLKKLESESELVRPDKKTTLNAKFIFKSSGRKDVHLEAKLKIDRGSVPAPVSVTLSYDTLTGGVLISPRGIRFLKPVLLDVKARNLDSFADRGIVYFVSVNADGTFDAQLTERLDAEGNSGWIDMTEAAIDESNLFLFGTDFELLTLPSLDRITKYESDSKLVLPNADTRLEAAFEYLTRNGTKVQLNAKFNIKRGSVVSPVTVSMRFDRNTGAIAFQPEGLEFSQPALLDVSTKNINSFQDSIGVEFVYLNPNGTFEPQVYKSMTINASKGEIKMDEAEINHFSAYAFGRRK